MRARARYTVRVREPRVFPFAYGSPEFYAALPKKHIAAGCLFLDDQGRILLVKPTYKQPWEIPGGGVEAGESPLAACRREVREELGLDRAPGRLLCVDHRGAVAGVCDDGLRFLFAGGTLSSADTAQFVLDDSELSQWRFVAADELDDYVVPALARRIRACLNGASIYLEDGLPPGE
jgi:8-oxo-dGTP diphosphatase